MNMHVETGAACTAGNYGDATLEDLAARYAALMDMTAGKNWPDDSMDGLTEAMDLLHRDISAAPCSTDSDYRGKMASILTYLADETLEGVADDIQEAARQLRDWSPVTA